MGFWYYRSIVQENYSPKWRVLAAPETVEPPVVEDAGGDYIVVSWSVPSQMNGILKGYALYVEDKELYSGGQTTFNVTGLHVSVTQL